MAIIYYSVYYVVIAIALATTYYFLYRRNKDRVQIFSNTPNESHGNSTLSRFDTSKSGVILSTDNKNNDSKIL